ncbi:hypothetical protein K9N50_04500 [bacterium]|nr:hypothetical protein [bacterium]
MREILFLIVITIFCGSASGNPTQSSMTLGDVELRLGSPKGEVISAMERLYKLTQASDTSYSVLRGSYGNYNSIGTVWFDKHGRLVKVNKQWNESSNYEAREIAKSLFALISKAAPDGDKPCVPVTYQYTFPSPDSDDLCTCRTLNFVFSDRVVSISIVDGSDDVVSNVTVTEEIKVTP